MQLKCIVKNNSQNNPRLSSSRGLIIYYVIERRILMDKMKRIFALAGVILLVAMYGCTLVFALMDSPAAEGLLMASIACTIVIPVLLYAYILVYRLTRKDEEPDTDQSDR